MCLIISPDRHRQHAGAVGVRADAGDRHAAGGGHDAAAAAPRDPLRVDDHRDHRRPAAASRSGCCSAGSSAQGLADQGLVFVVPYSQLFGFLIVATIFGVLAAILPARRAAKLNVLRRCSTSDGRGGQSVKRALRAGDSGARGLRGRADGSDPEPSEPEPSSAAWATPWARPTPTGVGRSPLLRPPRSSGAPCAAARTRPARPRRPARRPRRGSAGRPAARRSRRRRLTRTSQPRWTTRSTTAGSVVPFSAWRISTSCGRTIASPRCETGPTKPITNWLTGSS